VSAQRLSGVRVLVTRPRERAAELCFLLEDEGAEVVSLPLLELHPPEDPRPLQAAAERLFRYTWVAFASPSGVQAVCEAAREAGTREALYRLKVAAVGPRTAFACREHGLHVHVEAEQATGAGLAEALRPHLSADDQVLLPAAQEGRRDLEEALQDAGVAVIRVAAYRSAPAELSDQARAVLEGEPPHALILASPRTCEALWALPEGRGQALARASKLVVIGPTTAAALHHFDLHPAEVAEAPTSEGLVEAVIRAVSAPPDRS
jgi:uroporphyrinogen-III synthase